MLFPNTWRRARVLALLGAAAFLSAACMKMHASADILTRDPAFPDPGPGAPAACLRLEGSALQRPDFARAYAVSRFFSTGIRNESGSLAQLLEPALREALRRRGYRLACASDLDLEFRAEEAALLWLPPREFIQTPVAREKGEVRLDLVITAEISAPGKLRTAFRFEDRRTVRAAPGQEVAFLEHMTATALNACALEFLRFLPAANDPAH